MPMSPIPRRVVRSKFLASPSAIQRIPLRMKQSYGRNNAQVVTCTAITVPIVRAPFGITTLHRADPVTLCVLAIIPLPKPPAVAPMSQQNQNGLRGSCSGESVVDKKV